MKMSVLKHAGWIALMLAMAATAYGKPRVRLGGFAVSAGYSYGWGGSPFWGYGPFGYPLWGSPFFAPGYFTGFAYAPSLGEVRLGHLAQSGALYLDGAYAGDVSKLKHIWLEPGIYSLEVRQGNHPTFEKKIYVLSGKTISLRPENDSK